MEKEKSRKNQEIEFDFVLSTKKIGKKIAVNVKRGASVKSYHFKVYCLAHLFFSIKMEEANHGRGQGNYDKNCYHCCAKLVYKGKCIIFPLLASSSLLEKT